MSKRKYKMLSEASILQYELHRNNYRPILLTYN